MPRKRPKRKLVPKDKWGLPDNVSDRAAKGLKRAERRAQKKKSKRKDGLRQKDKDVVTGKQNLNLKMARTLLASPIGAPFTSSRQASKKGRRDHGLIVEQLMHPEGSYKVLESQFEHTAPEMPEHPFKMVQLIKRATPKQGQSKARMEAVSDFPSHVVKKLPNEMEYAGTPAVKAGQFFLDFSKRSLPNENRQAKPVFLPVKNGNGKKGMPYLMDRMKRWHSKRTNAISRAIAFFGQRKILTQRNMLRAGEQFAGRWLDFKGRYSRNLGSEVVMDIPAHGKEVGSRDLVLYGRDAGGKRAAVSVEVLSSFKPSNVQKILYGARKKVQVVDVRNILTDAVAKDVEKIKTSLPEDEANKQIKGRVRNHLRKKLAGLKKRKGANSVESLDKNLVKDSTLDLNLIVTPSIDNGLARFLGVEKQPDASLKAVSEVRLDNAFNKSWKKFSQRERQQITKQLHSASRKDPLKGKLNLISKALERTAIALTDSTGKRIESVIAFEREKGQVIPKIITPNTWKEMHEYPETIPPQQWYGSKAWSKIKQGQRVKESEWDGLSEKKRQTALKEHTQANPIKREVRDFEKRVGVNDKTQKMPGKNEMVARLKEKGERVILEREQLRAANEIKKQEAKILQVQDDIARIKYLEERESKKTLNPRQRQELKKLRKRYESDLN